MFLSAAASATPVPALAGEINHLTIVVQLLGGLAFFLFGMRRMTQGLEVIAGSGMRGLLERLTTNRFMAFLTGIFITAVIQSSSVTSVLVVGFVSAKLMTVQRSVGVLLGAMVGSTATGQILAFKVDELALPMITMGFLMELSFRSARRKNLGVMLMGLGLIFYGMKIMSEATYPLRTFEPFIEVMKSLDQYSLAVAAGLIFTAVVQSSSATIGIVILLCSDGFLSLDAGIAVILGAKIGTCVTALLAAVGRPREALRTALIHVMINVGSASIWIWFVAPFAEFIRTLGDDPARQVANAATMLTLGSASVFLLLTRPLSLLAFLIIPDRKEKIRRSKPEFIAPMYLEVPTEAVSRVQLETARLGGFVLDAIQAALPRSSKAPQVEQDLGELTRDVKELNSAIQDFGRELTRKTLPEDSALQLATYLQTTAYLNSMGENLAEALDSLVKEWKDLGLHASDETRAMVTELGEAVVSSLKRGISLLESGDEQLALNMKQNRDEVKKLTKACLDRISRRLSAGGPNRFEIFRLQSGFVELLDAMHHTSVQIAKLFIPYEKRF